MIRILFDVLSAASILVLVTLGLAIIAGMMGIYNLAHGEFILLGAVAAYLAVTFSWPAWTGLIVAPIALYAFGLFIEAILIRRLYKRPLDAVLVTWALAIAIRGAVTISLGGATGQGVPYPIQGSLTIASSQVSIWRLSLIFITALIVIFVIWFVQRSSAGLRIRAALGDLELARLSGISTRKVFSHTFALGSALAGFAGAAIVSLSSLSPNLGVNYLVNSFMALMIGGTTTITGEALGGTLLGASNSLVAYIIGPAFSSSLVLVLAVVVMRFRPKGLLPWRQS